MYVNYVCRLLIKQAQSTHVGGYVTLNYIVYKIVKNDKRYGINLIICNLVANYKIYPMTFILHFNVGNNIKKCISNIKNIDIIGKNNT